jgi:hypothetical protein
VSFIGRYWAGSIHERGRRICRNDRKVQPSMALTNFNSHTAQSPDEEADEDEEEVQSIG